MLLQAVALDSGSVAEDWKNVAKAVKRERTARGWSIRDACAVADVSPTTWINAEKGMRISDLSRAAIARALDKGEEWFDELLGGGTADDEVIDVTGLSADDKAHLRAIVERLKTQR